MSQNKIKCKLYIMLMTNLTKFTPKCYGEICLIFMNDSIIVK